MVNESVSGLIVSTSLTASPFFTSFVQQHSVLSIHYAHVASSLSLFVYSNLDNSHFVSNSAFFGFQSSFLVIESQQNEYYTEPPLLTTPLNKFSDCLFYNFTTQYGINIQDEATQLIV